MSMAACQAQCLKSLGHLPVTQCSPPIELSSKQPATVRFNRTLPKYIRLKEVGLVQNLAERQTLSITCHAGLRLGVGRLSDAQALEQSEAEQSRQFPPMGDFIGHSPSSCVSKAVHQMGHRSRNLRVVCAGAEGSGSCCGGSSSSGGGSCSSHEKKAPPPGVAGVGAEFENMVSRSTMQEFEKEYQTGQLQGLITRDIVLEVVNEIPELLNASNEERFVDVDAVLNEMTSLSNEDLVFDAELEGTIV